MARSVQTGLLLDPARGPALDSARGPDGDQARGPVPGPLARPVLGPALGPALGLAGQVALLVTLAGTVGLGRAGWVVGLAVGVTTTGLLARALARSGAGRLGPANRVTLARATLVGAVAAMTADLVGAARGQAVVQAQGGTLPGQRAVLGTAGALTVDAAVTTLLAITAVALALDAVDGRVARRTGTVSAVGARFDLEVDAFLILVLSVGLAGSIGGWVLLIGAARYAFVLAGWVWPWLRAATPPRYWCKVVAAIQGVALLVVATGLLPHPWAVALLVAALALLTESFGRDVWWLWRHRDRPLTAVPRRRRVVAGGVTVAALLVAWLALLVPADLDRLSPGAFVAIPAELLVAIGLAVVLPARAGRVVALATGFLLGLLTVVKIVDLGFLLVLDRPFDAAVDWSYLGPAVGLLGDSLGRTDALVVVAAAGAAAVVVLVVMTLAVRRLAGAARRHHPRSGRAVVALGLVWLVCLGLGARTTSGTPVASWGAAELAFDEAGYLRAGVQDQRALAAAVVDDPYRGVAGDRLLTGLRGKDVVIAFVESYGRVAVQGSSVAPGVDAVLDAGTRRLQAAGFAARSAFLTSPTFGGISWLAHSTLQSGLWIDSQRRYDQLVASSRFTLSDAFRRAGWRTVDDVPANEADWAQGATFYHYDQIYDGRNVGYRGPKFAYGTMPDEYVLSVFQRRELLPPHPPVMAEIDLVSSHTPWAPLPRSVDWAAIGDGSIFDGMPGQGQSPGTVWRDPKLVRAAYGQSIGYSLNALFTFVETSHDDNLVLVVLGDHQPAAAVTGPHAGHDVPVTVVAHDPAVLDQVSGWGWDAGMRPDPQAPVWPMNAFRDRFLTAFGPPAGPPVGPPAGLPVGPAAG